MDEDCVLRRAATVMFPVGVGEDDWGLAREALRMVAVAFFILGSVLGGGVFVCFERQLGGLVYAGCDQSGQVSML